MRTVAVASDIKAVISCVCPFEGLLPDAVDSGFFVVCYVSVNRGHHPPLAAVQPTNADKNGASAMCLLGEHPSGQRKVEPSGR